MKHWPPKRIITIISVLKQGLTKITTMYHTKLFLSITRLQINAPPQETTNTIQVALGTVTL